MADRIFGWDYPPGCSGPPEPPEPSELEDSILALLEDAGIDSETNDKIAALVREGEAKKAGADEPEYIDGPDDVDLQQGPYDVPGIYDSGIEDY